MNRLVSALASALVLGGPAAAQESELPQALLLPETVEVLRSEGLDYGDTLAAELFAGAPPAVWSEAVDAIFDETVLLDGLTAALEARTDAASARATIDFFTAEPGNEIARREVAARRALLDEAVEAAARSGAEEALAEGGPRIELLQGYLTRNDVIEIEVTSSMNLSLAFYQGLREGGALGAVEDSQILQDVYDRAPEIRRDVTERIVSFYWLAYQSVSLDDLETYVTFLESAAAQDVNDALTAAFDEVYGRASRQLGRIAASQMRGSDL